MRVAALGIDCSRPQSTWAALASLPPVDLLVLPELSFTPWLCTTREVDPDAWDRAAAAQDLPRLAAIRAGVVVGTMAVGGPGGRFNDAFCFRGRRVTAVHRKTYLPDEAGFWEASWYGRGPVEFHPYDTPAGRIGVSICTEMWFTQHAYPDVDVVVVPRATPAQTTGKWLAGGRAHAVSSGAFCVSSNRAETVDGTAMGATGWVVDPDGDVLATTTADEPAVVVDVDLEQARAAKTTYPRYVAR
jgi:N-carbamoylputrescine amidase